MPPSLYVVFDCLPSSKDGGLVATYANFAEEFRGEIEIKLVSVFSPDPTDIKAFQNLEVISLTPFRVDNRFPYALGYLKRGQIGRFLFAIWSALAFLLSVPIAKHRSSRLLYGRPVIASAPAAAIFLSRKVDYVLEVHTSYEYFWGGGILGRLQGALVPKPQLALFRNKLDASKAAQRFRSGYVYNCFDHHTIKPASPDAARRGHTALFVGRLASQKDPLRLLHCAARMRQCVPDFTLDIYGDGELRDEMEDAITKEGMQEFVRMRGFTSDKEIYRHYGLLWMTSLCEGFGLVLIEAMANGTPVITTHWGDAVFEVVKHGETGFVVDTDEEFVRCSMALLDDSDKMAEFSKNAIRDFEQRFTRACNKRAWQHILAQEFGFDFGVSASAQFQDGELPRIRENNR